MGKQLVSEVMRIVLAAIIGVENAAGSRYPLRAGQHDVSRHQV